MTGIVEDIEFSDEGESRKAESESRERTDLSEQNKAARLDESTLEPEAQVETTGDFVQAEAIEMAMHELIEADQESITVGGKGAFGQDTGDPSQHYSGVQMTQGEVLTDQDWNEDTNAPATAAMGGDRQELEITLDKDDRALDVLQDGKILGFVSDIEGSTTKAEVATHELGEPDIEKKDISSVSPGNREGMLDGQEGDNLADQGVRLDVEEGEIPGLDDDELRADPSEATERDDD